MLSNAAILKGVESGEIEIDPFVPEHINVTSYDLTLGSQVRVYSKWTWLSQVGGTYEAQPRYSVLDAKEEPQTVSWEIPDEGIVLAPGVGYLMHTHERVRSVKYNPILDGKSSIGRLFVQVHVTAAYGDPAFDGQYTLEMVALHPVRLYKGMRICQVRFEPIQGELTHDYQATGHYVRSSAKGAVPSMAWKQIQEMGDLVKTGS